MAASKNSKRLQLLSKIGLSLVAAALLSTLLGGWIAASQPVADIDQSKLTNYQESLQSYAAESLLLAQQYKAQRPTAAYTEVSFKKLFQATTDVADSLQAQQPKSGLDKAVKQTGDQANNLADVLAKLSKLPSGAELNHDISSLMNIQQQLEKSLGSS